ncbi:MBG domain-containing protein [Oscillibacter sp. MSJ-31]|uniref:MBG domain-containing protein n=1 Tax=Oscillibacter sp. MSJ-31 TaxID=2841526 RepID=UPI001C0FCDCC|nr:MBG domain-containing protein [Oscillibacter sp. MSJ-31]MBU5456209.1 S-layer homology domain-containing protein [Oscillibacter sp. MSJ-31]
MDEAELHAAFTVVATAPDKKPTFLEDGNKGTFTLVQAPALSVTVKGDLYDTSTAEEIKNALTVQYIDASGKQSAVTSFTLNKTSLTVGENDLTVTANGISETIKVTAIKDEIESIAVTKQPKLAYTSGETLDLSDMVVVATCKSGKTKTVTEYTTDVAAGTNLTVKDHDSKTLIVTADGKTAKTNALEVKPISVAIPAATGSYQYNGQEQSFTYSNPSDRYILTGELKGTDAKDYTATAALKDKSETAWSDRTSEDKTLTWTITPNTGALTVALASAEAAIVYDGNEKKPEVTVQSGSSTLTAADYTLTYSNNTNAGTATVKAVGKGNYAGAEGSTTFTIARASITPAVSMEDWTYNESVKTPTVTGNSGNGAVTYTYYTNAECTTGATQTKPTDAGTYWVKAAVAQTANYEAGTTEAVRFTIEKAAAPTGITGEVTLYHEDRTAGTLSASALTGTPADGWTDVKFVSVTGMTGDRVLSTQPTVTNGELSYIPTGTADTGKTSKVTATVSSRNYQDARVEITFKTVDISIDWDAIENDNITLKSAPVYGDKNSDILTIRNASYTAHTTVNVPGKLSVKDADSYPNAGATTVTLVFTPDENTGISGTFTHGYTITAVKAKPITVTANAASAVYGADIPAFDFEVPAGALVNNDTKEGLGLTLTTSASKGSNAGVYDITKNAQTTTNYDITVNGTEKFAITAKPLTAGMIQDMASLTYNGTAQTPDVTVKDGDKPLVSGTDYTAAYSNNTNAGTAKVVITGMGNYSGSVEKTFTIAKKEITVSGIIAVGRAYNGETTVDLDYTNVVFTGKIEGDTLTITATGTMADANVGTDKDVTISNLMLGGASKDNYALAADGQQTATNVTITKQPATPLSLTAKNAVYTGQPYAKENVTPSRNADEVRLTYYKDNNGAKGDTLNSAPANVGVYWVSGKIEESSNISEAVASAVKFQITKAPLTIKANDKTITYGAAPANDGVTYTGLVNNEDGADVVNNLTYEYNYTQYGNVGAYTITPKGATAANYDIKFVPGKLTVEQKEVGLTWNNASTLYYDGKAKNVTATATGLESNDAITVTVAGGKQTAIGSYSAAATGLTGAKAGNYKLPADNTKAYKIEAALTSVTVTPSTITATIDGLTIKLTGYRGENEVVTVTGNDSATAADSKLTVHDVEYTIDDSAVVVNETGATLNESRQPDVTENAEAGIDNEVVGAINNAETKGEGLGNAASDKLLEEAKKDATIKRIEVTLKIEPISYKEEDGKKVLGLKITPVVTYKDENGAAIEGKENLTIANGDIKAPVTITVKLPAGFTPNFAKHLLASGGFEMIKLDPDALNNGVAKWQQSSFSEVTLVSDTRTATITFKKDDKSTITKIYTAANLGEAFPNDSKSGYTFNGWKLGETVYSGTLTDEMLTALNGTHTLEAQHTPNGGGSIGGGGGGGGAATYPVSVDKAENGTVTVSPKNAAKGGTVTIEVKPDEGYELASVTVLDKDGKKLDVTLKNGKYSFVMPDGKVSIKAEFAKKGAMSFADVAANSWYYDAVKYCFDNGLMNGVGEDKFAPSATTTRAMIWTVLARDAGVDTSTGATWYEAGMKWAMENKISDGTGAENAITREQFATMLYRVAQSKGEGFTGSWYFPLSFDDAASISDWADEAMHWCVMKGILNGSNNKLNPTDNASRAEVAAMLMRFLTLDK